jgi:hypothetical protein
MSDEKRDIKTLDEERLKKILHYITAQLEVNDLTKGHLETVLGNTQKASNSMFMQLSVVNTSMSELTEKLLSMYNRYEEVSIQSADIIRERDALLKHIDEHAEKLGAQNGREKDNADALKLNADTLKLIVEMRGHIERLDAVYKQMNDFNDRLLDRVVEGINDFTNGILESLVHLQFEDITRQQIETIFKYLGDNSSYLRCLKRCVSSGQNHCLHNCEVPLFNIDDIRKYYVMESQRSVHRRVVETSASGKD